MQDKSFFQISNRDTHSFFQVVYSDLVLMLSCYHATHNAFIRSNKGIAMETLHVASQSLPGGQFMSSTQV